MNSTSTLDPQTPGLFADDALRAPLPALVMGDAAVRTRRHGWPGRLFVGMSYVSALGLGCTVLALGFLVGDSGGALWGKVWQRLLLGGAMGVLQWQLAGAVRRFSRWGWYGAMAELGAATLGKLGLAVLAPFAVPWTLPAIAANLAFMRYFWKRRADFDIDA